MREPMAFLHSLSKAQQDLAYRAFGEELVQAWLATYGHEPGEDLPTYGEEKLLEVLGSLQPDGASKTLHERAIEFYERITP